MIDPRDRWRDTYDNWKLETPPEMDEPDDRPERDPDDARDDAMEDDRLGRLIEDDE